MNKKSSTLKTKIIPVSCNKDCAAGCPLLAHFADGKILKITNNPQGTPYMQGCSKGFQAMQVADAPDRLLQPLIRSGARGAGDFKTVKNPLETPFGKIELASENYAKTGFAAVPTYRGLADAKQYPMKTEWIKRAQLTF
jgi:predicted molibdopterin-dependent oxidoreductase YjgC